MAYMHTHVHAHIKEINRGILSHSIATALQKAVTTLNGGDGNLSKIIGSSRTYAESPKFKYCDDNS